MTPSELRPGLRGEHRALVTDAMATRHVGGAGDGVLTTPSMILLMEETAQEVARPYLGEDQTTVGFEISVRHLAPTPVGEAITVSAELLEVNGKKLLFAVAAHNARRKIGEGTIRRTIISLGALDEA